MTGQTSMFGRGGHLGAEAQRDALVGLDADGEQVGLNLLAGAAAGHAVEDEQRRLLELDADLGGALLEPLAGAQIKRNARPAPVLNLQAQRRVGLRAGLGIDALFVAIADDLLALDNAGAILAAHRVEDRHRRNGAPGLHLFAAHGLGVEARRRLHGDKAEQLHHVVLHHVAQRAGLLVERPAAFDAQRFGRGDLHVVNVIAVPDRLEHSVGKAEDQNVLHRLFAEVVVDAEDLALVEDGVDLVVELARRVEVVAEGLFDDHRRHATFRLRHALRAEVLDDAGKELRRRGQIEEPLAADVAFLVDAVELRFQAGVVLTGRRS